MSKELTREQVTAAALTCWDKTAERLIVETDAALRATIEQQAQEIARLEGKARGNHARIEQLDGQLAAMLTERDDAVDKREGAYMRLDELRQQLAASQARVRELEDQLEEMRDKEEF